MNLHANDDANAAVRPPTRRAAVRARARIRDYTERVAAAQPPLPDDAVFDEFGLLESDPEDDDYDPNLSDSADSDGGESEEEEEDDDSDDEDDDELEDGSSMDDDSELDDVVVTDDMTEDDDD